MKSQEIIPALRSSTRSTSCDVEWSVCVGADSAWGVEEGLPEAVTLEMGKSRGKDVLDDGAP